MNTKIIAPIHTLNKHWLEVMNVFILQAGREYRPEDLADFFTKWRNERIKGPRDSVPTPGNSADCVVENGECLLRRTYYDPKKKPKVMAKAWPAQKLY